MGRVTTIHGAIYCHVGGRRSADDLPRGIDSAEHNARVLAQLPDHDAFPHLSRNMFSITSSTYAKPPLYRVQVIHLGASMKDLDAAWHDWLPRFELLLGELHYDRAHVRLSIDADAVFDYVWKCTSVHTSFEGGPRSFESSARG